MAIVGKTAIAVLGCLSTSPDRLASQTRPSLEVEARAGQVRSVLASKTSGEHRLRLIRPSGAPEESHNWRQPLITTLSWMASESGTYRVLCEPLASAPSPSCELSLRETANPEVVEVERHLRRGYELLEEWSAPAREQAEQIFRAAVERTAVLEDPGLSIDSRLGLARALALRGKPQEAVPLLEEGASIAASSGEHRRRILASMHLLECLVTTAKVDQAEEVAEDLLLEAERYVFPPGKAAATLGLGDVHYHRSEFGEAEELYRDALQQYECLLDVAGVIDARLTLGYALADQSRDVEARVQFEEALQKARNVADRRREALALRVLGTVHSKLNADSSAIHYLELARELFERAGDESSLVALYNSLGEVHRRVNDLPASLDYYRKASDLARRTSFPHGEGAALLEIGACLRSFSRHEEAIQAFERARAIFVEMGHRALEGGALAGLGNVYADRKEYGLAIDYLQRAVSLKSEAGDARETARVLNDLADVYLTMRNLPDAFRSSKRALAQAVESGELPQQARALATLASVFRRQGNLVEARRSLELALDIDEEMRLRVPGAELRALAFQGAERRYGSYVALMMQMAEEGIEPNASRLALEAVERSRSRALLDGIRGAFDREKGRRDPLAERENEILGEVRSLALQADLGVDSDAEGERISERLAKLRRLRGLATSPEAPVAHLPAALPVDEIEAYFAKGGALLLEYFLGKEQSYLWAVGEGRMEVHELAPEKEIEEKIQRAFSLLTARQVPSEGSLRERAARNRENDALFLREALPLSRALLGSVHGIDRFSRLVIVSDGALTYFPIGVLPHPERSGDEAESYVPLIASHEVIRAPSVTSLLAMASRAMRRSPKSSIAILADPVFTKDDPRVHERDKEIARQRQEVLSTLEANLRGSGRNLASLSRLLASREELASIAQIAPEEATAVTDFDADRPMAARVLQESYRVVHFATHGVLNDRHPELSGVVLSLVDEKGLPRDGFLRVQDLYRMRIETDIVVLSACETALGHQLRGEGMTGLVSALMHAGAGSVIASKWKVDDLATRQLMEQFYRGLFLGRLDAPAALRAAQISLWKRTRTRPPFYWGAFEVHGASS